METVENDLLYSSIKENLHGVIDIFVDGSYSSVPIGDIDEMQPFGAGWAIVGKDGKLAGYGVCGTWAPHTPSSDLSELRAILALLDAINNHHSSLVTRENVFRIHSDSQNLVGLLQKNLMEDELPPAMASRYGPDYSRIVKYRKQMTLTFHWVKGHAENEFNGTADLFARKCYRKLVSAGKFMGDERLTYIHTILSLRNIHPTVLPLIKPVESDCAPLETITGPGTSQVSIWESAQNLTVCFKSQKLTFKTAFIVSVESGVLYDHTVHLESMNTSREALQIKALILALKKYCSSDEFDPAVPLKVWSNAHIGAAMMNSIAKGKEPKIDAGDLVLKKNLDILRGIISGIQVRYIDDVDGKLNHLSAVSNIIFDSHLKKLESRRVL